MTHPLDRKWRALERQYAKEYPGSDPRPLRQLVAEMRAAEADAERARQLRQRGSISALRGPVRRDVVDVRVERCSDAVYLATPMTHAGSVWMARNLAARPAHLAFCNGLVLSNNDFRYLIQRKPDDMVVQIENYV